MGNKGKDRRLEGFLSKHSWIKEPMFRQVSEYGEVSDFILTYHSRDLSQNDDVVICLQQLTPKQRMYLRGKLDEKFSYWCKQAYCDKETQLTSIAVQAFARRDYTLSLIYRYISEKDIARALEIS